VRGWSAKAAERLARDDDEGGAYVDI